MAYRDLCRPCAEELRGKGKTVIFVSGGRDHKVHCSECGRRRFGATYKITAKERQKRVKSHVKAHD